MRVNLTDTQHLMPCLAAIEDWQPDQKGQVVRKVLLNVLPQARQKQELQVICQDYKAHLKEEIVGELQEKHPQEYAQFTANKKIKGVPLPDSGKLPQQVTQAGKNMDRFVADHPQGISNGSDSLNAAIKKYAAVNTMESALNIPQPVYQQLQGFKQTFQSQSKVIEKDRDSWGMKFMKGVAAAHRRDCLGSGIGNEGSASIEKITYDFKTPSTILGFKLIQGNQITFIQLLFFIFKEKDL